MSTALTSLDQLGQQAAAHLSRIDIYIKRHDDNYIAAGKYLIEARQICRAQSMTWTTWLAQHGIDRTKAHIAIAEAGGDASMEEGGRGRPGGIKAATPSTRREYKTAKDREYRAAKKQQLLSARTTNQKEELDLLLTSATNQNETPPTPDPTPREVMLARITTYFNDQPDSFLASFIQENIP